MKEPSLIVAATATAVAYRLCYVFYSVPPVILFTLGCCVTTLVLCGVLWRGYGVLCCLVVQCVVWWAILVVWCAVVSVWCWVGLCGVV